MIVNLRTIVNAELEGRSRTYNWRKTPSQITQQGIWFDLSMSPGMPVPQYYIGAVGTAVQLRQSTDGGIYHGPGVYPFTKYIRSITTMCNSATPLPMIMNLMDYLLFYSFIDEGTTDEQFLVNNVSLPRCVDGKGVQVMAVSVAGRTGGQRFTIKYTNSDGVANRISQGVIENSFTANGTIVTSATATNGSSGLFVPLQSGDSGVRSIQSVTMQGVDVGLFALVLVKPLLQTQIKETTAPYEKDMILLGASLPVVEDDAFLGFACIPNGSLSGVVLMGDLKVIWIQ
jgi:hypothetical protein